MGVEQPMCPIHGTPMAPFAHVFLDGSRWWAHRIVRDGDDREVWCNGGQGGLGAVPALTTEERQFLAGLVLEAVFRCPHHAELAKRCLHKLLRRE